MDKTIYCLSTALIKLEQTAHTPQAVADAEKTYFSSIIYAKYLGKTSGHESCPVTLPMYLALKINF
jgi:hypothetical protein